MENGYSISVEPGYVWVKNDERRVLNTEEVASKWKHIAELCQQNNLRKILIEGQVPIRQMTTYDVFFLAEYFQQISIAGRHIALLLSDQQSNDIARFFETVTANRGTRIKYFTSKQDALEWFKTSNAPASNRS